MTSCESTDHNARSRCAFLLRQSERPGNGSRDVRHPRRPFLHASALLSPFDRLLRGSRFDAAELTSDRSHDRVSGAEPATNRVTPPFRIDPALFQICEGRPARCPTDRLRARGCHPTNRFRTGTRRRSAWMIQQRLQGGAR